MSKHELPFFSNLSYFTLKASVLVADIFSSFRLFYFSITLLKKKIFSHLDSLLMIEFSHPPMMSQHLTHNRPQFRGWESGSNTPKIIHQKNPDNTATSWSVTSRFSWWVTSCMSNVVHEYHHARVISCMSNIMHMHKHFRGLNYLSNNRWRQHRLHPKCHPRVSWCRYLLWTMCVDRYYF